MAKNKEVVRCVRQQTIATYDVNDGFSGGCCMRRKRTGVCLLVVSQGLWCQGPLRTGSKDLQE